MDKVLVATVTLVASASAGNVVTSGDTQLCGPSSAIAIESFKPLCSTTSQVFSTVDWTPCCVFEQDESLQCRHFEMEGAYCDESSNDGCEMLSEDDKLTLELSFNALPVDEQCCKTCVCFGDPECVSFNNVEDLWIPCDARRSVTDCRAHENICTSLTDPNGNSCVWNSNDKTSRGWDIAMEGSPCQPVMDSNNEITMKMYESEGGDFRLDLYLGERGIISETRFTIRDETYVLNAQRCFDTREEASTSWVSSAPITTLWRQIRHSREEVLWQVFDEDTQTSATLLCVRATTNEANGMPRINVQALSTMADVADASTGFCSSGVIADKKGDYASSADLHHECVASQQSALQACKALVSAGLVDNQLPECAAQFCTYAAVDTDSCISNLGNGNKNNRWAKWYCLALLELGEITDTKVCENQVKAEGWAQAVTTWGQGRLDQVIEPDTCGSELADYLVEDKDMCVEGVYMDVMEDEVWVPKYFIPATNAPCDGMLNINAVESRELFTKPVRMRQCDPSGEEGCNQLVSTCGQAVGVNFSITYTNKLRSIFEMYDAGVLACKPHPNTGSTTWCLPDAEDLAEEDQLCPCTPDQSPVGRRLGAPMK